MLSDPVDVIVCKFKSLLICEYSEDKDRENLLIKIGGTPILIQDEESYYKELEKHGALYLYKHCTTNEIIAVFWQCS